MGSKKYREFFDEDNLKDKLSDFSPINTNECSSEKCKDMQDYELLQCMKECCHPKCEDKSKSKIIDNGKTLTYSEFDKCMTICTDP